MSIWINQVGTEESPFSTQSCLCDWATASGSPVSLSPLFFFPHLLSQIESPGDSYLTSVPLLNNSASLTSSLLHGWTFPFYLSVSWEALACPSLGITICWILNNIFPSIWGTSNKSNLEKSLKMWHVPPDPLSMASSCHPS